MAEEGQNRTEQATPKKRSDAKKKGDVVESRDLSAGFALVGAALMLMLFGSAIGEGLRLALRDYLGGLASAPALASGPDAVETIRHTILSAAGIVAPFLAVVVGLGVAAQFTMHGLVWSPEKLTFDISKVNPFTGFGKIFNLSGFLKAVFAILKLVAIASVMLLSVRARWGDILHLGDIPLPMATALFCDILFAVLLRVGAAVLVLGVADLSFQRWKKGRDLRMTKQEVKEERRQTDGDPQVKARIRTLQRERARQRMMEDVDTATVVVTNPTHFAVALRYDRGDSPAPKVVAKGLEHLAHRIRERAEKAGVPIVEEPPLARTLFRTVRVGDYIPAELYRAVAAVLSYVYRLRGGLR